MTPVIPPPGRDGFYHGPSMLERTRPPGELLRAREIDTPALPVSTAYQILYVSRSTFDEPTVASATVLIPDDDRIEQRPILAYGVSVHGLGGTCAPSYLLRLGLEPEAPQIALALRRGWAVVVADGEGLGVVGAGPHSYLAGQAGAHTMLDAVRAAGHLPAVDASARVGVWGYADGGRAATWAAELAASYAPELHVTGAAAGAVVADLAAVIVGVDGGPVSALGLAGLIGLSKAYQHLPLRHLLTPEGHEVVTRAERLGVVSLVCQYPGPLSRWCERPDPWNDPLWRHVLDSERCGLNPPSVPLHLYHGGADQLVPIGVARRLYRTYRDLGASVTWREYAKADHRSAATVGALDAVMHLATHLAPTTTSAPHEPACREAVP